MRSNAFDTLVRLFEQVALYRTPYIAKSEAMCGDGWYLEAHTAAGYYGILRWNLPGNKERKLHQITALLKRHGRIKYHEDRIMSERWKSWYRTKQNHGK